MCRMKRRTLTMDWDGLGEEDDDDDRFFESNPRMSSVNAPGLCSSGSEDDEEFEDSRMSFASAISTATARSLHPVASFVNPEPMLAGYDMWTSEPGDIRERRRRFLRGMGLGSNKDMLRIPSQKAVEAGATNDGTSPSPKVDPQPIKEVKRDEEATAASASVSPSPPSPSHSHSSTHPIPVMLVRSRSEGDIVTFSAEAKQRQEELLDPVSKQRLTRTSSEIVGPSVGLCQYSNSGKNSPGVAKRTSPNPNNNALQSRAFHSPFSIKNLDNGKEFIMKDCDEGGLWNKVRDVQTGKQFTMEEFERSVGSSQVVKELMGRQDSARSDHDGRKIHHGSSLRKRLRKSKKKILKNIKGVATSKRYDHKEHNYSSMEDPKADKATSKWVKTQQHGKSYRDFTALHMTQDIQAHTGSIWTIKFSWDAHLLATAGEDRVIHVWEVQECEVMSARFTDDASSGSGTPAHPMTGTALDCPPLAEITPLPPEKRKKSLSLRKKGNKIPDYVNVPETVFALSEKPICTFIGHQEDVLDLSWSKSQQLLSSSTDKTVRLWDLETKTCLKMFEHNDYVTCIQFNPVDNDYFMSGSLDAKVRIWKIPDHQVVDWIDLQEMVTAAAYTPDGQGAVVGSHQGYCRFYTIEDCKLEYCDSVRMRTKAQSKKLPGFHSQPQTNNKITGFQFFPSNPSEVLVTSTDSRIRLHNGSELVQKYRGFKNTSSQISGSFSPDGRHVISASEDCQVYIWKVEESKIPGGQGKKKTHVTVRAHEYFPCKDVSVAIPWPGSLKNETPLVEIRSKRHTKRLSTLPQQHVNTSPTHDQDSNSVVGASGRKHLPPLIPRKNKANYSDEDFGQSGRMDTGIGVTNDSFDYGESGPSSKFENGGHGGAVQATAWGLVIVTAGLDGEIRVYQNFGLPLKVGRL